MGGKCPCQQDDSEKRYSFHIFSPRLSLRIKASASYFACVSPATTAASLSSIWFQPSNCPLFFALSMGSFPMWVSLVWPFPRSSKRVTSYAPSMASCSIPSCAGSILFPFESEKYIKETIFSCGTISWYSTAFQNSCPSGDFMQQRNFPPTRKSISQTGAVKPLGPHNCIQPVETLFPQLAIADRPVADCLYSLWPERADTLSSTLCLDHNPRPHQ